jgi:hypothetical protein
MYCCVFAPGNLPILLDYAHRFSPLVEEHPDMVVFDIRGLEALQGPPDSIARAVEREADDTPGVGKRYGRLLLLDSKSSDIFTIRG